jgi:hypothetical protein
LSEGWNQEGDFIVHPIDRDIHVLWRPDSGELFFSPKYGEALKSENIVLEGNAEGIAALIGSEEDMELVAEASNAKRVPSGEITGLKNSPLPARPRIASGPRSMLKRVMGRSASRIARHSSAGVNETFAYNSLWHLTRMTATQISYPTGTAMDMSYTYTAGQNNGRISASTDWVSGETVNYTYDSLNHLASAAASNGSWGNAYTYDGFGNLTAKTVTAGSAPNFAASYDPATNRQSGLNYDANGNQYLGSWLGYPSYDLENRMIMSSDGISSFG